MTLHRIVRALGGDLYDGGRRANVPAPGHSRADRSVSLWLRDHRLVVHTFGDGDWRGVLDHLRGLQLVDTTGAPSSSDPGNSEVGPADAPSRGARQRIAARLWTEGRGLDGTLSAVHARRRGIRRDLPGAGALRHHPEAPVAAYRWGRYRRPALLAGILTPAGDLTGVEVTYLTPEGRRAEDLRLSRKTVGLAPGGCAVRLDPPAETMLVGEGVFTTLSATDRFGLPGWALLSTRNLRAWTPPAEVRSVLIAADRGRDGEESAAVLWRRLRRLGLDAEIALPPAPAGDWNEWAGETSRL
ncbi:toprim domain-containing protein [Phenylobacterium sp.]|uniref:toprim domain-containing protein n=1 Tax=Phenylobacterium sp. TaxID=1871053 RepID=UPI003565633F